MLNSAEKDKYFALKRRYCTVFRKIGSTTGRIRLRTECSGFAHRHFCFAQNPKGIIERFVVGFVLGKRNRRGYPSMHPPIFAKKRICKNDALLKKRCMCACRRIFEKKHKKYVKIAEKQVDWGDYSDTMLSAALPYSHLILYYIYITKSI